MKYFINYLKSKEPYLVALFILILVFQCLGMINSRSYVIDELPHLARAVNIVKNRNFQLSIFHPPLMNMISGIPFLFVPGLKVPVTSFVEQFGNEFLYRNTHSPNFIVFLASIPTVVLSAVLALLVFTVAKRLYGAKGGFLALILYVFNPTIIASSSLFTTDLGLTFFSFLALFAFLAYSKKPSARNLILFAICVGLALVTKYSAMFLIPVVVFLLSYHFFFSRKAASRKMRNISSFFLSLCIIGLVVVLVINLAYGFSGTFRTFEKNMESDNLLNATFFNEKMESVKTSQPAAGEALSFAIRNVPLPLPYNYVRGFGAQLTYPKRPYYYLGKLRYERAWSYNIVVFLIKSPLILLVFMAAAIIYSFSEKKFSAGEKVLLVYLLGILLFFMAISQRSGVRYLLPIFPCIFILTSRIVNIKLKKQKVFFALAAVLLVLYAVSSLAAFPKYLTFYNELIGPVRGCEYSLESDCDYGQGMRQIKQYMDEHNIEKIKLSHFGSADPDYYGINYEPIANHNDYVTKGSNGINCDPTEGILVISYWNRYIFFPDEGCFDWLDAYEPIDRINDNILVYNITLKRQ